jgi:hypothetical protein
MFLIRLEPALLLVAFAALEVDELTVATSVAFCEVAVALVSLPLPPTGVAFAEVEVAFPPLPLVLPPTVVEAATPLAGAAKTFPRRAHPCIAQQVCLGSCVRRFGPCNTGAPWNIKRVWILACTAIVAETACFVAVG